MSHTFSPDMLCDAVWGAVAAELEGFVGFDAWLSSLSPSEAAGGSVRILLFGASVGSAHAMHGNKMARQVVVASKRNNRRATAERKTRGVIAYPDKERVRS